MAKKTVDSIAAALASAAALWAKGSIMRWEAVVELRTVATGMTEEERKGFMVKVKGISGTLQGYLYFSMKTDERKAMTAQQLMEAKSASNKAAYGRRNGKAPAQPAMAAATGGSPLASCIALFGTLSADEQTVALAAMAAMKKS